MPESTPSTPDMNRPAPETRPDSPTSETGTPMLSVEEQRARQVALEEAQHAERLESERRASDLSIGLKREPSPTKLIVTDKPQSDRAQYWGAIGKTGVAGIGVGIGKVAKYAGYGLSALFQAMEQFGTDALRKFWLFKWLKPKVEKTWRETDIEAEEKAKKEAVKKKKEKKQVEKLEKHGFSKKAAESLLGVLNDDDDKVGGDKTPVPEPKPEPPAEKAA